MKEITIRLHDNIANFIEVDARQMGLTPEELIRHMVGVYAQSEARKTCSSTLGIGFIDKDVFRSAIQSAMGELDKILDEAYKKTLKARARAGALTCKDCTMRISEEDIDKGECSACHAPLKDMLKGEL